MTKEYLRPSAKLALFFSSRIDSHNPLTYDTPMHNFYIPVMGTGFTIDTPLKVAPFGISSVVSLVDDKLAEQMFAFYQKKDGLPYSEISKKEQKNWRSGRLLRYLNLLQKKVDEKFEEIKTNEIKKGTDLYKYYELLPPGSLKSLFESYINETDNDKKIDLKKNIISSLRKGRLDVNIMTKLNRVNFFKKELLPKEYNDALASLKAYADSNIENSAIIFSAGMNAPLYTYLSEFADFYPDKNGQIKKMVIIKVSDYRSSYIQGKFLAKKGIWVSEYRIESGLNCGGHAFATDGILAGPTLQEFKDKNIELKASLYKVYKAACEKLNKPMLTEDKATVKVTYQGGLAYDSEAQLLTQFYGIDQTGWGTPFLLVPEVINMDDEHVKKLQEATINDVHLSHSSPLGIPFWNLKTSFSEEDKFRKINNNKPGSACPKGFLVSNSEYTDKPICTASIKFQTRKLKENEASSQEKFAKEKNDLTLTKSCICHDLAGPATLALKIDEKAKPCICCGPNIVHFKSRTNLENMTNHIYGRPSNVVIDKQRPHFLINELNLYVDYLHREKKLKKMGLSSNPKKDFGPFIENLKQGINYYKSHVNEFQEFFKHTSKEKFLEELNEAELRIDNSSGPSEHMASI